MNNPYMQNTYLKYSLLFFILISIFSCSSPLDSVKSKLNEAQKIKNELSVKKKLAIEKKEEFDIDAQKLQKRIQYLSSKLNIISFDDAINDYEIDLKLRELQRKKAYRKRLFEMENNLKKGIAEYEYVIEDFNDKILIGQDFNEEELEEIVGDLDKLVEIYIPMTEEKPLKLDDKQIEKIAPKRETWEEIIAIENAKKKKIEKEKIEKERIEKEKLEAEKILDSISLSKYNTTVKFKEIILNNGFFTDYRDGQKYRWADINGTIWMVQNLNYGALGSYYDNDKNNSKYGRLYNNYEAKLACPPNWHLPSIDDWNNLQLLFNDEFDIKESIWTFGKGQFGYPVFLSGSRTYLGDFKDLGVFGNWWSNSSYGFVLAHNQTTIKESRKFNITGDSADDDLSYKLSVRCVKDKKIIEFETGIFIDNRDNKQYQWIKINGKKWMAQNLNYDLKGICYDNDGENCTKFGRLYTWEEAKVVCPPNWHLPNNNDWKSLNTPIIDTKWTNGKKQYGYSAFLTGRYTHYNKFSDLGINGYWWSLSVEKEYDTYLYVSFYKMNYNYNSPNRSSTRYPPNDRFCVRCVED